MFLFLFLRLPLLFAILLVFITYVSSKELLALRVWFFSTFMVFWILCCSFSMVFRVFCLEIHWVSLQKSSFWAGDVWKYLPQRPQRYVCGDELATSLECEEVAKDFFLFVFLLINVFWFSFFLFAVVLLFLLLENQQHTLRIFRWLSLRCSGSFLCRCFFRWHVGMFS